MHPNEALARREIDLISQQDVEAHRRLCADDCVFHYPGKSALAGTYRGLPEFMARLEEVFDGVTITRELHDALGSDDLAVQVLRVTATAGDNSHTWRVVWIMHVVGDQFSEAWALVDDQYAGAKLREDAQGCPLHPGATGKGKAGRVSTRELLMMPRHRYPWRWDAPLGSGLAAAKRQAATGD